MDHSRNPELPRIRVCPSPKWKCGESFSQFNSSFLDNLPVFLFSIHTVVTLVGFHAFGLSFLPTHPALHWRSSLKHHVGQITTQLKSFNAYAVPLGSTQQRLRRCHLTTATVSSVNVFMQTLCSSWMDIIFLPSERYIIYFLASISFLYYISA